MKILSRVWERHSERMHNENSAPCRVSVQGPPPDAAALRRLFSLSFRSFSTYIKVRMMRSNMCSASGVISREALLRFPIIPRVAL